MLVAQTYSHKVASALHPGQSDVTAGKVHDDPSRWPGRAFRRRPPTWSAMAARVPLARAGGSPAPPVPPAAPRHSSTSWYRGHSWAASRASAATPRDAGGLRGKGHAQADRARRGTLRDVGVARAQQPSVQGLRGQQAAHSRGGAPARLRPQPDRPQPCDAAHEHHRPHHPQHREPLLRLARQGA